MVKGALAVYGIWRQKLPKLPPIDTCHQMPVKGNTFSKQEFAATENFSETKKYRRTV